MKYWLTSCIVNYLMVEHEFDDESSIPLPKEGWNYESILLFSENNPEAFLSLVRGYIDSPGFDNAFPSATSYEIEEALPWVEMGEDWEPDLISQVFADFELERAIKAWVENQEQTNRLVDEDSDYWYPATREKAIESLLLYMEEDLPTMREDYGISPIRKRILKPALLGLKDV